MPTRAPGRPRSALAHAAILEAAVALIREQGFDALTIDGIAARAGVGKATVYRRWRDKETLVVEAVGRIVADFPSPDTGSVERDLQRMMLDTLGLYRDPASAKLLSGLIAAIARSAPIAEAVRAGFVATRNDAL
ncbi:MAG TPA: TetR/AcrR family transcriptional regulator, partial [Gemmatimonadaceae bacterium]|nr:TetR/AcrR family transcriptional regulator [Gemmatimonadaceae bacterium]